MRKSPRESLIVRILVCESDPHARLEVIPQEESRELDLELDLLKSDIAARLRSACSHFPDGEFATLVDQIARIETKYALRDGSTMHPDSPTR